MEGERKSCGLREALALGPADLCLLREDDFGVR